MKLIGRILIIFGISIFVATGTLYGGSLTFDYAGTCSTGCGDFGLNVGDPVTGFFTIDSSLIPGTVSNSNIGSLGFTFGSASWNTGDIAGSASTFFNSGPGISDGSGLLADNSTWGLAIFPQGFSTTSAAGAPIVGDMLVFPESNFSGSGTTAVAGSVGQWTAATPEPATMALFGTLLGLWGVMRRRKS